MVGVRRDARFCSDRCRKTWHRRPHDLRVDLVGDLWAPPTDEQIELERHVLATAPRQTRRCRCESPVVVTDLDHRYCLKCARPIRTRGDSIRRLFRLIARFVRYPRRRTLA
jgi:predicted nucleic acid-binding Zn ribbon protein